MQPKRREFLAATATIIGGTVTGAITPLQASSVSSDSKVLDVISRYGTLLSTSRSGGAKVEHTVKMRSVQAFISVFDPQKRLPFDNIQVGTQNTLSFSLHGTRFTLRNVA